MLPFDLHERTSWAGRADLYRRTFALLCAGAARSLLDAAGALEGVRLLDVGTGPGTVARLAAARGALVSAVDPDESMAAAAAEHVPDVRVGALPDLPFDRDAYDIAVGNFVVNHVGDPAAAIRDMCRVVRPGGTVAVTIWPSPAPVTQRLFGDAFTAAGVVVGPSPRLDAEHDFARTPAGLDGLLTGSGLIDVTVSTIEWIHRVDAETWWSGPAGGLGTAGHALGGRSDAEITRIKAAYDRLAAGYRADDGLLALPASALLGVGRVGDV
jgi:SAM-dependent methyltransferase